MTSAAQRIRGVLAALALLAFVGGIPSGLLVLGAGPARLIPERWPEPASISQWPERIWATLRWAWITGDLVIWLIVVVAWAGWLALTVSVALEVVRQTGYGVRCARGLLRAVPRGWWIASLVTAVLVATSAGTAAASGAPAASVAATAPLRPHAPSAEVPETVHGGNAVSYTVVYGDTLWGLAERHLGKGTRYHEIVRLNTALLAENPDDLEPGWTLLLPPDAAGLARPVDSTTTGRVVTVNPADTLSGIAERELGDPDVWPAIFRLNAGRAQPDGRALRHPNQLMPGWNLVLPVEATTPPQEPAVPPSVPSPMPAPATPGDSRATVEEPANQGPQGGDQRTPTANSGTGISLPTGAFVGLGLAALTTIAMITVRIRRRRSYRPGVRVDADPAGFPVVRALRIAHDAATRAPDDDVRSVARPPEMHTRELAQATVRAVLSAPRDTPLGVRDGQAVALDLASTHGLGLVGPGAHAAARALTVALLAQATSDGLDAMVVIPAADARTLFGSDLPDRAPARLRVVDDMSAGLDALEAELLVRTHADDVAGSGPPARTSQPRSCNGPVVLVAAPARDTVQRAHTVLCNGSQVGLAGVFLGAWRPGGTARVRNDGVVETTSPVLSEKLDGARLFTLPDGDARDLLALLEEAARGGNEPTGNRVADDPAPPPSRSENTATNAEQALAEYEFIRAVHGTDTGTSAPPMSAVVDFPGRGLAGGHPNPSEAERSGLSAVRSDDRTTADLPPGCSSPAAPLHLDVLGRLHLIRADREPRDVIEAFAPRQREILVLLALYREGCRRETVGAALWPDAPGERPYNSFHATLSQLRRALRRTTEDDSLDLIVNQDSHYRLNQAIVTVDLWQLRDALIASRSGPPADANAALNRVTELYRGDLAEGISAEWIEGPREALRREVLEAFSILIRKVRNDDPEQTLDLLEQARRIDPYNEAIYRDLMRVQARLGQHDSIPRTLHLLTTSLADLDQPPARDTLSLADALRQPNTHIQNQKVS